MTSKKINLIGYLTGIITFIIATIILAGEYFGWKGDFKAYGLIYIPIAFFLNILVFILMTILVKKSKKENKLNSFFFMLLNIPVAIIYLFLGSYLVLYFRITIINDTSNNISTIQLHGCDNKYFEELTPGESKTFWLETNDCSILITYINSKNEVKRDEIISYVSGGGRDKYHISGKNNPHY